MGSGVWNKGNLIEYTGRDDEGFWPCLISEHSKANAARLLFSDSMQIGHDHYRSRSLNSISKYDPVQLFIIRHARCEPKSAGRLSFQGAVRKINSRAQILSRVLCHVNVPLAHPSTVMGWFTWHWQLDGASLLERCCMCTVSGGCVGGAVLFQHLLIKDFHLMCRVSRSVQE